MRFTANIIGVFIAVVIVMAMGIGGYFVVRHFVVLFARLDFSVATVTATAIVALLLAAMLIAGSIRRAGAQSRKAQLRADKAEAYKLFIGLWDEILRTGQTAEAVAPFSRQMQDVNQALLLHGCTGVLKAHAEMLSLNLQEARAQFADALLAIRKDLGLDSRGLTAKDLDQFLLSASDNTRSVLHPAMHQDTQPRVSLASNS